MFDMKNICSITLARWKEYLLYVKKNILLDKNEYLASKLVDIILEFSNKYIKKTILNVSMDNKRMNQNN